jgi:hypothetical protein
MSAQEVIYQLRREIAEKDLLIQNLKKQIESIKNQKAKK